MSFLDKLHRNELVRDHRPDAELKKLFGKGKDNTKREQVAVDGEVDADTESEGSQSSATKRFARMAIGAVADRAGEKVDELQAQVDGVQGKVQTKHDKIQSQVDNGQDVAKKKLPGKLAGVHRGIDGAQDVVRDGLSDVQGRVDDVQADVQQRVGGVLDPLRTPRAEAPAVAATTGEQAGTQTEVSQAVEPADAATVDESAATAEPKKKRGVFGQLAKLGIKPELKVGGFEIGIDDDSINLGGSGPAGTVRAEQEYGKGKKLGRDANVDVNVDVAGVDAHVNQEFGKGKQLGRDATYDARTNVGGFDVAIEGKGAEGKVSADGSVGPATVHAEQAFGKGKQLGHDASVSAKAKVLGMPIEGEVRGEQVFKRSAADRALEATTHVGGFDAHLDGKQGKDLVMHEAAHVEQQVQGRLQQADARMRDGKGAGGIVGALEIEEDAAADETQAQGKAKKKTPHDRLARVALGQAEDNARETKPADDKDVDGNDLKDSMAVAGDAGEDENQDDRRLPGKVGAVAKQAKQALAKSGKSADGVFVDSKHRLEKASQFGDTLGSGKPGKASAKDAATAGKEPVLGKVQPRELEALSNKDGKESSGDGAPDDNAGHPEVLKKSGLVIDESEGNELEDADGNKVPYSPTKSKGAPSPKASKGAQPGGHTKPPAPPEIPSDLTTKNQQAVNAYIAQAKRDRDAAKGKVQAQQLAKSQQVSVDAKAIAQQVKQKNDVSLAKIKQQAELKKQQAQKEAQEKQKQEGPVTVESLTQKLETSAQADKDKLKTTFETKKSELQARMQTQRDVLKEQADKQVQNLKDQQAKRKQEAEQKWAAEKKVLEKQRDDVQAKVREQTRADEQRLKNDQQKIIAASNAKVTKLKADNDANCKQVLAEGKASAEKLKDAAYKAAKAKREAGNNKYAAVISRGPKEEDGFLGQARLIADAEAARKPFLTEAQQLEAKGRMDHKAAIKQSEALERTTRAKGEKAIQDVEEAQKNQSNAIDKKIKDLALLCDEKIRKAETDLNAKLKKGDEDIKKLIDDTDAKITKLRAETEQKIAKLEADGLQKLQKDYDAAVTAIDKRVEAARKHLAASNGKNLKALEKMVDQTVKAIEKSVTDTEKKLDSTIQDAEKKAQAFVIAQLQKIKAEADKALKAIDDEFAAAMKRIDDAVAKAQDDIDDLAKGKMLEIEVHTATLLSEIGEGSRLDAVKKQFEWYIKNGQPIPQGYGQEPAPVPSEHQKTAQELDAQKTEDPNTKKEDPNAPKQEGADAQAKAVEPLEEEARKKREELLKEDNLSPEGIAAKVEEAIKNGQKDTAGAKVVAAQETLKAAKDEASTEIAKLHGQKTAELELVKNGDAKALADVQKHIDSEKAGEKAAADIDAALKKTNMVGLKSPDKAAVMKALEGKDEVAIAAMREALLARGINLDDWIRKNLSDGQQEEALVRLQGDPLRGDLVALKNAQGHRLTGNQKGALTLLGPVANLAINAVAGDTVGEDNARINELIQRYKDQGKLDELATEYEKMTGQSLAHLLQVTDNQKLAKELGPKYEIAKDEGTLEDKKKAGEAELERLRKEFLADPKKAEKVKDIGPSAEKLIAALQGVNLDSTRNQMVLEALRGKSAEEVALIKAMYKKMSGRDLDLDLQNRVTGSALAETKAEMRQDKAAAAVARVMGSEEASWTPWTVDDKKMHEALRDLKDPEERRAVLEEYEKRTGKKLQEVIADKMTGNDEKLALALADGDYVKAKMIEIDEATNGGWMNGMHKAIAERTNLNTEPLTRGLVTAMVSPVGAVAMAVDPDAEIVIGGYKIQNGAIHQVDSAKMFELLEDTPNPADRARIKALYKEQTGRDMDDDMAKNLVGPSGDKSKLDAYKAIQDGRMDDYYAARMDDAVSGLNDSATFHKQLEGKPDWQRKQILEAYKKRHGGDPKAFEAMLKEQFGEGSMDAQKAQLLATSQDDPKTGVVKLPDEFVLKYAQDSVWSRTAKYIDENTAFVDKYPMLAMVPGVGQAKAAAYFMRGWGVDTETIKSTLAGKSKEEIEELKKKYPELEKDLNYTLSGRDLFEINLQLKHGEPQTEQQKIERRLALYEFDRGDSGAYIPGLNKFSNAVSDLICPSGQLLDHNADFLKQQLELIKNGQELSPEAKLALHEALAGMEESTTNFLAARDAVTNGIATAVGVVAGAVVTVLTGGVAGAILAALATGAATVGTKLVMLGQSYGRNEIGVDLAMTVVQMATAGIGGQLGSTFMAQVLNGAIGSAAAAFVQTAITSQDARDLLGLLAQATKSGLVGMLSGGAGGAVQAKLGQVMEALNAKAFGPQAPLTGVFTKGFVTGGSSEVAKMLVEGVFDPASLSGDWDKVFFNLTKGFVEGGIQNAAQETAEQYGERRRELASAATEAAKKKQSEGGSIDEQRAEFARVMEEGWHKLKAAEDAAAKKAASESKEPDKVEEKLAKDSKPVEDTKPASDDPTVQQTQDPSNQQVGDGKTSGQIVDEAKQATKVGDADAKPKSGDDTIKTSGDDTLTKPASESTKQVLGDDLTPVLPGDQQADGKTKPTSDDGDQTVKKPTSDGDTKKPAGDADIIEQTKQLSAMIEENQRAVEQAKKRIVADEQLKLAREHRALLELTAQDLIAKGATPDEALALAKKQVGDRPAELTPGELARVDDKARLKVALDEIEAGLTGKDLVEFQAKRDSIERQIEVRMEDLRALNLQHEAAVRAKEAELRPGTEAGDKAFDDLLKSKDPVGDMDKLLDRNPRAEVVQDELKTGLPEKTMKQIVEDVAVNGAIAGLEQYGPKELATIVKLLDQKGQQGQIPHDKVGEAVIKIGSELVKRGLDVAGTLLHVDPEVTKIVKEAVSKLAEAVKQRRPDLVHDLGKRVSDLIDGAQAKLQKQQPGFMEGLPVNPGDGSVTLDERRAKRTDDDRSIAKQLESARQEEAALAFLAKQADTGADADKLARPLEEAKQRREQLEEKQRRLAAIDDKIRVAQNELELATLANNTWYINEARARLASAYDQREHLAKLPADYFVANGDGPATRIRVADEGGGTETHELAGDDGGKMRIAVDEPRVRIADGDDAAILEAAMLEDAADRDRHGAEPKRLRRDADVEVDSSFDSFEKTPKHDPEHQRRLAAEQQLAAGVGNVEATFANELAGKNTQLVGPTDASKPVLPHHADDALIGLPIDVIPARSSGDEALSRLQQDGLPRWALLNQNERAHETAFLAELEAPGALREAVERFTAMSRDKEGVLVFEVDAAKKLYSEYGTGKAPATDGELEVRATANHALHPLAVAVTRVAFLQALDQIALLDPSDPRRNVFVTNGGCAAGKGSLSDIVKGQNDGKFPFGVVWDAAGEGDARENGWILEAAKQRGLKVTYGFVQNDPMYTYNAVLNRALGSGRIVDPVTFARSYARGQDNMQAFLESKAYKDAVASGMAQTIGMYTGKFDTTSMTYPDARKLGNDGNITAEHVSGAPDEARVTEAAVEIFQKWLEEQRAKGESVDHWIEGGIVNTLKFDPDAKKKET